MKKTIFRKRYGVKLAAVLCTVVIFLTGCTPASTIEGKPFDVDGAGYYKNLLHADFHGYAFHFQDDIKGQLMTQEVWQDGECIDINVLWHGGVDTDASKEYYLAAFQMRDEENRHIGQELQGKTSRENSEQAVHATLAPVQNVFPMPTASYGYYFVEDTLKVEANGTYILALWDYEQDTKGFKPLDLDKMHNTDYTEQLKDHDYVILLKLQLFDTEEAALKRYQDAAVNVLTMPSE